jgi:hypothetical protein
VQPNQSLKINNSGQILTEAYVNGQNQFGYIYQTGIGIVQVISVPGAAATTVRGFNNSGNVVGFFTNPPNPNNGGATTNQIGFLFRFGIYLGGIASSVGNPIVVPEAINDNNIIVGESTACGSLCLTPIFSAFVDYSQLLGPTYSPIIVLPSNTDVQQMLAINDSGLMLAVDGPGTFCCGPEASAPLPAALPLFATGLGALGLLGWRRKRKAQAGA